MIIEGRRVEVTRIEVGRGLDTRPMIEFKVEGVPYRRSYSGDLVGEQGWDCTGELGEEIATYLAAVSASYSRALAIELMNRGVYTQVEDARRAALREALLGLETRKHESKSKYASSVEGLLAGQQGKWAPGLSNWVSPRET